MGLCHTFLCITFLIYCIVIGYSKIMANLQNVLQEIRCIRAIAGRLLHATQRKSLMCKVQHRFGPVFSCVGFRYGGHKKVRCRGPPCEGGLGGRVFFNWSFSRKLTSWRAEACSVLSVDLKWVWVWI